ncbi:MAG TPA: hypothetical protein VHT24_14315 [Pseudacidobacterium sp.]|jgi:hypothetical protein|nr:hypothetical protein [Pseudacidobacterium sp.]
MAPATWKTNAAITALKGLAKGGSITSKWPPILDAVKAYEELQDADRAGRTSTLGTLDTAINVWTENQGGFFTIVKDKDLVTKKKAALANLQALILAERQELAAPQPAAPIVPVIKSTPSKPIPIPTASKPIAIGGGTGKQADQKQKKLPMQASDLPQALANSWKNPEIQKIGKVWQNSSGDNLLDEASVTIDDKQLEAFKRNFQVFVHFTKEKYKASIFQSGLFPGEAQGIGLVNEEDPSVKEPDKENVYVVSGSVPKTTTFVSSEAGGEMVVVVSLTAPTSPDRNYKGGAYYFTGAIPPVRDPTQSDDKTFSFTLPMGPRTATGLCNLLNTRINPQVNVDQAAALLLRELNQKFTMHFMVV